MSYDWPAGWNETRTERAVQGFVCDTLDVPKYAVRCSIDNDEHTGGVASFQPVVQIFKPLTGKRTADVHEVFGRLVAFAGEHALRIEVPKEKIDDRMFRTQPIYIWEAN